MKELVIGTHNQGKLREMKALLSGIEAKLIELASLGVDDKVDERGSDYVSNARLKAVAYSKATGLWAIADDTGLEVEALEGAPGLFSARLPADIRNGIAIPSRTDDERRQALLRLLVGRPRPWVARFYCAVALAGPTGTVDTAEGACPGQIIPEERGQGGFGYDPIFLVGGTTRTMAELSLEEKNRRSHRAIAVRALLPVIRDRLQSSSP
jgi:XTP/dITP diphosphohydrolase